MIRPHLARQLGPAVQAVPLDPILGMALQEALGASRSDPEGSPVVLVHPSPGGAQDALYVVQASRLPDLLASTLAAQAGVVRRLRYTLKKEQDHGLLPGTRPSESAPTPTADPAPVVGGDDGGAAVSDWGF